MAEEQDRVLVEGARIQRMRLAAALLFGRIDERRTVNDNMRRLMGSLIVAAIVCAGCVGVSYVSKVLADQAAQSSSVGSAPATGRQEAS
ncbi:hypothetical protein IF188_10940 [Microbacterium sp. NEAU-LLC]|uniref:Uncharacterized protein n=1 Tax=Microbacterium helvum TaxID=2773713 RepID=A0ABR8NNJ4_9MICO|nr:hypothetical protein [Microbacterium helvum]MBD3942211.1 hypothetical protein [Microbacterium helvum]